VFTRNRIIDRIEEPHSTALGVIVARAAHPLLLLVISVALRLTGGRRA
jgi:hypothetical protein